MNIIKKLKNMERSMVISRKKRIYLKYLFLIIVVLFTIIYFSLSYINGYFGWTTRELWKIRMTTSEGSFTMREKEGVSYEYYRLGYPPTESVNRGVFIKKMNFIVEQDSLKKYFNLKDTLFYIERGFKCTKKSAYETVVLTEKETDYPYQLSINLYASRKMGLDFKYQKWDNLSVNDSLGEYGKIIALKDYSDTLSVQIKKNSVVIGKVKIF